MSASKLLEKKKIFKAKKSKRACTSNKSQRPANRWTLSESGNTCDDNPSKFNKEDLTAALIPDLASRIKESIAKQIFDQFAILNVNVNKSLQRIREKLDTFGNGQARLGADIKPVTAAMTI